MGGGEGIPPPAAPHSQGSQGSEDWIVVDERTSDDDIPTSHSTIDGRLANLGHTIAQVDVGPTTCIVDEKSGYTTTTTTTPGVASGGSDVSIARASGEGMNFPVRLGPSDELTIPPAPQTEDYDSADESTWDTPPTSAPTSFPTTTTTTTNAGTTSNTGTSTSGPARRASQTLVGTVPPQPVHNLPTASVVPHRCAAVEVCSNWVQTGRCLLGVGCPLAHPPLQALSNVLPRGYPAAGAQTPMTTTPMTTTTTTPMSTTTTTTTTPVTTGTAEGTTEGAAPYNPALDYDYPMSVPPQPGQRTVTIGSSTPSVDSTTTTQHVTQQALHKVYAPPVATPPQPLDTTMFTTTTATTATTASTTSKGLRSCTSIQPVHQVLFDQLQEMFPQVERSVIETALEECDHDIDRSVSYILNVSPNIDPMAFHSQRSQEEAQERERRTMEVIQALLAEEANATGMHSPPEPHGSTARLSGDFGDMARDSPRSTRTSSTVDEQAVLALLQQDEEAKMRRTQEQERLTREMLAREQEERQRVLEEMEYDCAICLCPYMLHDMYLLDECSHKFCSDCLNQYISERVRDHGDSDIICPEPSCQHLLSPHEIKHVVTGSNPEILTRFYDNALRNALAKMPDLIWCPRPGCETAMIGDVTPNLPMLVCPSDSCSFTFCFNCKDEWHADSTCEQYQEWKVENASADTAFAQYAREHTKACPKCTSPIEKSGGCNHMLCTVCKHEFCWLCRKEYKSGHFRRSTCSQYS